jgi:hypothetical protein
MCHPCGNEWHSGYRVPGDTQRIRFSLFAFAVSRLFIQIIELTSVQYLLTHIPHAELARVFRFA